MLRPVHIACVVCALLVGVGIPDVVGMSPAWGDASTGGKGKGAEAQALALYKEAQALKQAGNFRQALAKVQEAYSVLPTPTLLWPLADLHYLAKQPVDGLKALARYRREMVPAEMEPGQQIPDVERLEAQLRAQLAYLRISVPSGTLVTLDGQTLDAAQRADRIAVNPGSHQVLLTTEAGKKGLSVDATAGAESTVTGEGAASVGSGTGRYFPHPLTWAAVGVTSALLLSTTIVGGMALSDAGALASRCPDHLCLSNSTADVMAINEQVSAQQKHALAGKVLLGVTAVFAVGTSALIIFDWQRQRTGRTLLGGTKSGAAVSAPASSSPAALLAPIGGSGQWGRF